MFIIKLVLISFTMFTSAAACGGHTSNGGDVSNGGNVRNGGDGEDEVDCGPWKPVVCDEAGRDAEFPGKHKKYSIVYTPKSWYEADRHCKSLCKSLAAITSVKDQHYMEAIVDDYSINPWLGGQCGRQCRWKNTDSFINSGFKNWASGHPRGPGTWGLFGESYNCVVFNSMDKQWSTSSCGGRRPFVCQSFL